MFPFMNFDLGDVNNHEQQAAHLDSAVISTQSHSIPLKGFTTIVLIIKYLTSKMEEPRFAVMDRFLNANLLTFICLS